MRIEPSLTITPEGSLDDLPAAVGNIAEDRERESQLLEEGLQGTSSEKVYMEIPDTRVKTVPDSTTREVPIVIQRAKEASREEAIKSTRQFFATVNRRNTNISSSRSPTRTLAEVCERDVAEAPNVSASTAATTPVVLNVEPRGTSSPRISLPEGSPCHPAITATCRPRTWMQQITEGQNNEPTREGDTDESDDSSDENVILEEIPDELGHEWRVLHPFKLPGVRFPTDSTPPNQRRLAENNALVELIQTTEYLDDVPMWGQRLSTLPLLLW